MARCIGVLRGLISLGLLAMITWMIDAQKALSMLANVDLLWTVAAVWLVQIQVMLSAFRWRITAQRLGLLLSPGFALREYYLSTFINQIMPGGVAGDAVRAWRHRGRTAASRPVAPDGRMDAKRNGWGPVVRAIVLERAAGQIAFLLVAAVGVIAWPSIGDRPAPSAVSWLLGAPLMWFGFVGALAAAIGVLGPKRWRQPVLQLLPDLRSAYVSDGIWLLQGTLSLLIVGSYIATFAIAAAALGAHLPGAAWITVVPLVLLTMLVPIAVGGWGLREGAAAALWPIVGLSPSAGVATSILYGLIVLAGSLPGLLVLLTGRSRIDRTTARHAET